jgi:hypothetical protein
MSYKVWHYIKRSLLVKSSRGQPNWMRYNTNHFIGKKIFKVGAQPIMQHLFTGNVVIHVNSLVIGPKEREPKVLFNSFDHNVCVSVSI